MKKLVLLFCAGLVAFSLLAQNVYETQITFEKDEYWWGGAVGLGAKMPYTQPLAEFDLALQNNNNQVVPFFLSNKGRFIWSNLPFKFEVKDNSIIVKSQYEEITVEKAGKTLKDAYLAASGKYFPPSGVLPDELFFTMPQYNTWIELMYNQNETDIMNYAQSIVDNDFPVGVLMIDDNWQKYYGNFDFKPEKFSDPKAMIDKLHAMGFKVMLWICPFVSADSPEYRDLAAKGYLIKRKGTNEPAVINWWNGYSACYDLTNPAAKDYFIAQLKQMQQTYGVDGFKFDAGDNQFYNPAYIDSYKKDAISVDHTMAWAELGLEFPFNEYRAGWRMGGEALVQRLGDKDYSWKAVRSLISEMLAAGMFGYAYACPDMIGGGQFTSFLGIDDSGFDQDLIVRSTQVHTLMPMMQFSVAPWRILNEENLETVRKAAKLHVKMGDYIIAQAKLSSHSGEPIVRHMEYAFPNEGFATCVDQFMLGDKYMVAPVVGAENVRQVKLPKGRWKDEQGKVYKGGKTIEFNIPMNRLLYFEKLK
ncbi:glycoside hydrolase [Paludibacter sp. 221]|uniref:glycoside hydrolase family 31 protein n=1 Tax=Paludibacter sp. 221 TaxID=2302939 RepID=UPI0013D4FA85|nr:glycoside hydrolase family 31 protein [Paludibacter sp. 221]NDV46432.1 glycoside hydrolase [Paludibacter sp. 221]